MVTATTKMGRHLANIDLAARAQADAVFAQTILFEQEGRGHPLDQ